VEWDCFGRCQLKFHSVDRRSFLAILAAGTSVTLAGCSRAYGGGAVALDESATPTSPPVAPADASPALVGPPPSASRVPVPSGALTAIPGQGNNIALTVDDGANADVVGAYIQFAKDTGARFTFFVTGVYDGWTVHKAALRPLVESGQIQLANHTWDHPDLTALSPSAVASQFDRTKTFLSNTFGVDGTPFYRPPFGYHNASVDMVAADHGYTVPTLWYGSLSDSGLITEQYLLECAHKYFTAQSIIIGHANHPPVTHVYGQLVDIIRERNLAMVTLNDVFTTSTAR
jgi:peptidoglycan/xylan/chitin deacetylase (PgdA/CDA1 family)